MQPYRCAPAARRQAATAPRQPALPSLASCTDPCRSRIRCDDVDGVTIFPKLPVFLRTHATEWQKNRRVRDAVGVRS